VKNALAGLSLLAVVMTAGSAWAGHFSWSSQHHGKGATALHQVPELDPSVAGAALVLIAGGVAIAHGRRRRAA
jgi:hypothetical protein